MIPLSSARPLGVTVLGWLLLSFAILLLIVIAIGYSHPDFLLQWHLISKEATPELQNEALGDFILFGLPSAIASLVIGVGLLALRSWARWSLLVFFGLGFCRLAMLIVAILVVTKTNVTVTPSLAIATAINGGIVYYLTRPRVKDAFGEGTNYRV